MATTAALSAQQPCHVAASTIENEEERNEQRRIEQQ